MVLGDSDFDTLEQYDYSDGEYIEKHSSKYASLIGLFLIDFSSIESDLNSSIADFIHDDSNVLGFIIIEKLSMKNKIELFSKLYSFLDSATEKHNKIQLHNIKSRLDTLNEFRNAIAHANWQSLDKEGYVRTKIVVDNLDGYVKFKKIKITPATIRKMISEIHKLSDDLFNYTEKVFNI